ncbi:arylsulfatase [Paenibacillus sp.]|uniref:arylsulfatase n=1 Tax=Paenibacillus sp. TaxID=58172 RepID=UPI002D3EBEEC|nr:arylsulfatase [Paenibacillus sp.]HZG84042.1 arylsulfatase [Paenibacillus sp.]
MAIWEREQFEGRIGRTVEESIPWWPKKKDMDSKPNIVLVLLDDLGFSQLGCYGSDISTPNIDALAQGGLRYNNFHTTALCAPSRAALLTGRNPHSVGLRTVLGSDAGFPNARGRVSKEAALLSEMLLEHGYNTFGVGKWHLVTNAEQSFAGPFDSWPLGRGFEHYYGFLGGATSHWNPELVDGNRRIPQPKRAEEGYHLTEDLTDKAIEYIREQRTAAPDRPFFCYVALGAPHAPHHAPKEFIDKYKGKYDKGWDRTREEWFERQKELGIIPKDTQLPPRNPDVRAWDELNADEKRLYARLQEAFAGFLEHTDYHIGRLIRYLQEIGQYDNTIIMLLSDNGACHMGGDHGNLNQWAEFGGPNAETFESKLRRYDEIGTPQANNHYPKGWAHVGNTPLRWYKSDVHAGGVKDPLIIHYPAKIKDGGSIRNQYHHVIDIVPTILELTGTTAPDVYKGVPQMPLHGVSMAYTLDQPEARSPKKTQIYEMNGNRAIFHEGWKAVSKHKPGQSFDQDRWELYNLNNDFNELDDLATAEPQKLQQLIELWWSEAERYGFLPLENRPMRASLAQSNTAHQTPIRRSFYRSEYGLPPKKAPELRNKPFEIRAEVHRSDRLMDGVIVAAGGSAGGYSFYVKHNRLVFANNRNGVEHQRIVSSDELPTGSAVFRFKFEKTGDHEGVGRLYVNDEEIGTGQLTGLAQTGMLGGYFGIGQNAITPVVPDYQTPFRFSGELIKVEYFVPVPESI